MFQQSDIKFRQQLFKSDDEALAEKLGFQPYQEYRNFDVYVFEYCHGNIKGCQNALNLSEAKSVCHQLLIGLEQLEKSGKCHNDLKPENILYNVSEFPDNDGNNEYVIKICDFGSEGKSGGTPGWTWPKFMSVRRPGRSDMYSIALLILYVLCESDELFFSIRNNFVITGQSWMSQFRNIPVISMAIQMMNLEPSVGECLTLWEQISDEVVRLSKTYFKSKGIDTSWLEFQSEVDSIEVMEK